MTQTLDYYHQSLSELVRRVVERRTWRCLSQSIFVVWQAHFKSPGDTRLALAALWD